MKTLLVSVIVAYVVAMYGVAFVARGRIHDAEDYLVAGRGLGWPLATATLFATWFGAGTLLTAAQEVREGGLRMAALDPLGAGVCLILVGLFFAAPLHRMGLLTLPDFYGRRFGRRTEKVSAVMLLPVYFGWIAAQFVALAEMLHVLVDLDLNLGIAMVVVVGTGYTLLGGMWSVALTDAVQVVLLVVGLMVLSFLAASTLGGGSVGVGVAHWFQAVDPDKLTWIPAGRTALVAWISAFAAGALGNIPGQDLMQRVFASRSATVAQAACVGAGLAYLAVGLLPLFLALSVDLLGGTDAGSAIPALAQAVLSPTGLALFTVVVMSAVLSTIDSALLSPASIVAQNLWPPGEVPLLVRTRVAVTGVAAASWGLAVWGADAYALLEGAYELGLVALLAPLALGLVDTRRPEGAALSAIAAGFTPWAIHFAAGWPTWLQPWLAPAGLELPVGLCCAALAAGTYLVYPSPHPAQA